MAGLQGRTLGGYQLTEQIASAGIAEVYRARPLASNGREAVFKVIYPEFARYPGFLPNFQQIVQTATRLANHPHILPVVASGEENGYLYLATPWVADGTLRDYFARGGRLGVSDTGPFFQQLSSALAYAHSMGLVHGNLKPSNIFLYEGRHVMLGDFGMLWDIRQLDMNHSGSGTDVVEYLAPESFTGQFSQQSDIYSLGAILFATLTGRPPFSASKPADLRDAHMQFPPPRLGQVDATLSPGLQALDPIIQQAMAKRPEDRFPSATAFAQAIDTVLKQQPAAPAMPPMQPAPSMMSEPAQQPASMMQPGVPGSWASPGPIQPAVPQGGLAALPAPSGAVHPLNPQFPPVESNPQAPFPPTAAPPAPSALAGWPAADPMSNGWPAGEPIQYTERVPAPPLARPLLAPPQQPAPANAVPGQALAPVGQPEPWAQPPSVVDDPEWGRNGWTGGLGKKDDDEFTQRRQVAPPAALPSQYSHYSQYTDQRIPVPDDGFGSMSRADWGMGGQSGPHSEALRYRGGFSPTELGLPRLTNPALQDELPPEWEDLLADEHLPRRSDIELGRGRRQAPSRNDPPSRYDSPSRYDYGSAGWPPSDGKQGGQRAQPNRTLASVRVPAYKADRAIGQERPRQSPVARNRRGASTGRGVPWKPVIVLIVLVLVLVGGTGVVLKKPTLCPGTICSQANHFLRSHVSILGPAPNSNILAATPGTLTVHAVAGGTTNLDVQMNNTGVDPAIWHASISVPWITMTPSSGTLAPGGTAVLDLEAHPVNVTPGSYTAQVHIVTAATALNIPIAAAIAMGPKLALSPTKLSTSYCGTGNAQPFKITNAGDEPLTFTVTPSDTTAIHLDTTTGTVEAGSSATINVTMDCSVFFADFSVSVASNGGSGTVAIHYGN